MSASGAIELRGIAGLSEEELLDTAKSIPAGASIDLCGSGLTKKEIELFFPLLWKSGLRALDISSNSLGPDCVHGIADLIRAAPMEEFRANGNPFGPDGVQGIANAVRATTATSNAVRILSLRETNAGPTGAKALADMLAVSALTSLDLDSNAITDEGAIAIMEAEAKRGQLVKLALRNNGLTKAVAKPLADMLAKHPALETFAISQNALGKETASLLSTKLYSNMVLRDLDLKGCELGTGLGQIITVLDSGALVTLTAFTTDATKEEQKTINSFLDRNKRTSAAKAAADKKDAEAAARARAAAGESVYTNVEIVAKKDNVEAVDEYTRAVLKDMLHVANAEELGKGFDVKTSNEAGAPKYTELEMVGGWKILNDERANRYTAQKGIINMQCTDLRTNGIKVPAIETLLAPRALGLGPPDEAVNECWLFHGTSPDHLVQMLSTGLNERLASSGLFGAGAYFCDRIEKADQYVLPDTGDAALAKILYPEGHPGGELFYVFVARVTMGCTVRTIDALTDVDRGGATTAEAARGEET